MHVFECDMVVSEKLLSYHKNQLPVRDQIIISKDKDKSYIQLEKKLDGMAAEATVS